MTIYETYMQRCLQLAALGGGQVAPNPMVGSVLVYNDRIIGEGYHRVYGQAHAEVNCIASVRPEDRHLVPDSTIYVSLEPCAHYGKTPPCADLIISQGIRKVVVGCRDPFEAVDGKGIEKLRNAGIEVMTGVLEKECHWINRRFFTYHTQHKPYVLLKWAQTADGKIAGGTNERLLISNAYSNRLVHRWRSEEMGILVGTRTAQLDNPSLSNRLWHGPQPVKLLLDMDLKLPLTARLFQDDATVVVFNTQKHTLEPGTVFPLQQTGTYYYQLSKTEPLIPQLLHAGYQLRLQSILVEGGANLLQQFIDSNSADEVHIITNTGLFAGEGLAAPALKGFTAVQQQTLDKDQLHYFVHQHHPYFPYHS
ncbi:bifunctional diaminohydroxyphosphoribosylaminopyrimidine deaminase/5-amino-6-(5-phosphoribosylamino)uracil reductase RibD [Deminuibacter soli]|uniref:Riboflavin biosynthesis protein RibD n=1 Tax=Deminuibacter soli TaxID=2291815 RepID=A0A3E1NLP0_9BACT|nr:bifunctional diaminohydroxyphosphoribosylaminopyrimidine deaminase/5-amino-6-(5-phosphoribosylamino)uracil reductase RibD [Deminuibacter soli]RFM28811.1 bifunctional diaminohydroxyphosphoribosylaminopyrimidine deaminase/5-amino-6-(5-phosphoribosylamino)uracil reductase RibD [Deminuibacter soli]